MALRKLLCLKYASMKPGISFLTCLVYLLERTVRTVECVQLGD